MKEKISLGICLVIFTLFGFAQVKTDKATEEFDEYESRDGFGTPTPTRKPTIKTPTPTKSPGRQTPTVTKNPTATPIKSVGKPGMKIWFERQIGGLGKNPFLRVSPTSSFQTGDRVRVRFRLNFEGYLTIKTIGTSGKISDLFPDKDESNKISPKTDYYLPKTGSWRFKGEPGNEQLIFIVSKSPLKDVNVDDYIGSRSFGEDTEDLEVYDRDIVSEVENDEVYILSDETRIEKPIVFRLTLKHRAKK